MQGKKSIAEKFKENKVPPFAQAPGIYIFLGFQIREKGAAVNGNRNIAR